MCSPCVLASVCISFSSLRAIQVIWCWWIRRLLLWMSASTGTAAVQLIKRLVNKLIVHLCVVLYFERGVAEKGWTKRWNVFSLYQAKLTVNGYISVFKHLHSVTLLHYAHTEQTTIFFFLLMTLNSLVTTQHAHVLHLFASGLTGQKIVLGCIHNSGPRLLGTAPFALVICPRTWRDWFRAMCDLDANWPWPVTSLRYMGQTWFFHVEKGHISFICELVQQVWPGYLSIIASSKDA